MTSVLSTRLGGTTAWSKERESGSINGPGGRLHAINPQYRIDINWPRGSSHKDITTVHREAASNYCRFNAPSSGGSHGTARETGRKILLFPSWSRDAMERRYIQDDPRIRVKSKTNKTRRFMYRVYYKRARVVRACRFVTIEQQLPDCLLNFVRSTLYIRHGISSRISICFRSPNGIKRNAVRNLQSKYACTCSRIWKRRV